MAIHTDLPIHRTGIQLMSLAMDAQMQMPRGIKRSMGEKISQHCTDMLELMALANATQRDERVAHIRELLSKQRALTVLLRVCHEKRWVSNGIWAQAIQLLDSIGKQGGGWLKKTQSNRRPAA